MYNFILKHVKPNAFLKIKPIVIATVITELELK